MNNNDFSIHFNNDFDNEGLKTWYISEKHGFCFGMAYVYAKQKNKIILSDLSVDEDQRNKGYGTALQELREQIGIDNNCKWSCLWVKKGSWQRKWYARRGYKYEGKYEDDKKYVWLKKKL